MAFVSLLDAKKIQKYDPSFPNVHYTKKEGSNIFLGALLVIFVQTSMLVLLTNFMESPKFIMQPAINLGVMVPRILSSIMAHLNVVTDIRQGISMMKYTVNHPQNFKSNDPNAICKS